MKVIWIVFGFATAAAVAATGIAAPAAPDTIYLHGKVVTVDAQSHVRQAFAVRGDRFVAAGTDAQMLALASAHTRRVDLGGATVIPGLSDNHDHLWNAGKYLVRGVDMIGVTSWQVMQDRLRAAVANAKPGEVVSTTTGWAIRPAPTRAQLDQVSSEVPIVAISGRRGTGVFNSAALTRLGVSKANPVYMGVKVPVDQDGEPTGVPPGYPVSVQMIDALLPPLTPELQDALVKQAQAQRNALGITSVRELSIWPAAVQALQRMRREGKLTVRMALGVEFPDQDNTARHLAELPAVNRSDPWLFLDCVSEEPWAPGSTTVENFTQLAREVNRLGWRPAPHVNADTLRGGTADAATEATLSAYEAADRDSPLQGKRWYLEHVPFSTPQQMERMARLGLVISTQDAGYRPVASAPLPPDRMAHQNPIRALLDHQLTVIGGSDYSGPTPTDQEPNNPMIEIYFYSTRKTQTGSVDTPSEKISRDEALRIFTTNAAYATFQEKRRGQIAPGMLADFVILNQDLMSVPDDKLLATRAVATFVGGKKVYAAAGAPY